MPSPKTTLPPVYFSKDQWIVRVPGPTSRNGSQVFKGRTVGELITALQRNAFHATWFLHQQNQKIKSLEARLKEAKELLTPLLGLKGTK